MPLPEIAMIENRLSELSVRELIIKAQIDSLTKDLAVLQREIGQLQIAKAQFVNPDGVDSNVDRDYTTRDAIMVNRVGTIRARRKPTAVIQRGSIKEDALRALSENPNGLLALDVLAHINGRREKPIERTSLSPQLSRLRQAGLVYEENSVWQIAPWGLDALADLDR